MSSGTLISLCKSIASAPGKVILFGEHAVVHGSKAIAAALSDLCVTVEIDVYRISNNDKIIVNFEDLDTIVRVDVSDWKRICKEIFITNNNNNNYSNTTSSVTPNETIQKFLIQEFEQSSSCVPANQGMMAVSFVIANILPDSFFNSNDNLSLKIRVKSTDLPIGAGLGSSAAFSVALVASSLRLLQKLSDSDSGLQTVNQKLLKLRLSGSPNSKVSLIEENILDISLQMKVPLKEELLEINKWAYAAEVLLHGNPSGLDNTTSCFGGILEYSKIKTNCQFEFLPSCPCFNVLLINSKVPRSTKQLVASVQSLKETFPQIIQSIFDSINEISLSFVNTIKNYNGNEDEFNEIVIKTGKLFEINRNLLNSIGVGHEALEIIHKKCRSYNFPCKLTGAGGGGCAISLITDRNEDVSKLVLELESLGYNCFHSVAGGHGVMFS